MNMQDLVEKSVEASRLLAMLSSPHRLRLLCALQQGECSVSALEAIVGLSQSAVSQHLAKLRAAGVVATRREAQTIYYSIADARAARLLSVLYEIYCAPSQAQKKRSRK